MLSTMTPLTRASLLRLAYGETLRDFLTLPLDKPGGVLYCWGMSTPWIAALDQAFSPLDAPDLYVIECLTLGAEHFKPGTLDNVATVLGILATGPNPHDHEHTVHPAEDMPALQAIAADVAANRPPF